MRIRKHAKLSSLLNATSSSDSVVLQAHVCQFNQSPWDVMNFSPPSSPLSTPPPPPPPPSQVNENGPSAINDSSRASISALKWEECDDMEECDDTGQKWDCTDGGGTEEKRDEQIVLCCKTDGRSWQCSREANNGNSMCEHHLSLARNHNHSIAQSSNKKKSAIVTDAAKRRSLPKKPSASSSSSNPYEYYYYSGFGPRWGKKRGEDKDNGRNNGSKSLERERVMEPARLSEFIDEDLDYIEDEDEEEELYQKKRARKPVKARSLKSLM